MSKKKLRLVRTISGVVHAFVHGEKPPEGQVIGTKDGALWFNGKLLLSTRFPQTPAVSPVVMGVLIKPSREALVTTRQCKHTTYVMKALDTPPCKIPKLRQLWFKWLLEYDDSIMPSVINELFCDLEQQANKGGVVTKSRDQVVADWNYLCHAIGYGHLVGTPPKTGY